VKLENIRHGLRTFDTSFFQAPGRMNIFDEHGFKVILDYAHNPAAVEAMCRLVRRLEIKGRRHCVIAAPGDRRDEDVREIARHAAGVFDRYICRRDDGLRGRKPNEIPEMLREGLLANGVPGTAVAVIPSEVDAVDAALRACAPGDLLLVFGDSIARCWKQIIYFRPDGTQVEAPRSASTPVEAAVGAEPAYDATAPFMRDERGVWLPAESDD
jgi:cyanophycin synthetase